ncbi:G-D-S-L family lipolytic protein [Apibacter muscae]|uniref:G-D-S-L family lipolytic protein n=1 Tax=Apibacter muscae TaxID=2509004 RepID=A0A563DCU8_9FLAO|nr:SGNH/GDSL hydrolase family protein [Apibacter muscae]TWP27763.1 G-D-S-L family lipolytic protein [Apibacter muscae]
MKKKYLYLFLLPILALTVHSCKNSFDEDVSDVAIQKGQADFSRYVALGNSLTSGYRDNALYISGQKESYPVMLATQMKYAGGGDFKVPYMNDELGGIPMVKVENKKILAVVNGSLSPVTALGNASTTLNNLYSEGPFQNMGVPGAKSFHLIVPGYGNPNKLQSQEANPYFVRFASSPESSVLSDAMLQNPTFFSLWIGNNDVLGYATSGGDGTNPITDISTFDSAYKTLVQTLTSGGAKGVVANIPDVTSIPFFTTVPYNPLSPQALTASDPKQIDKINTSYSQLNQIFEALGYPERKIVYSSTQSNPVLIKDKSIKDLSQQLSNVLISKGIPSQQANFLGKLYGQSRPANSKDYLLLTASSILGKPNQEAIKNGVPAEQSINGVTYPLEDQWVLTEVEVNQIKQATIAFNNIIKNYAEQYNLAFVDVNKLMNDLSKKSGITYDGVNYTSKFVTGGAFSLDGVHPSGRGYAFIANEFIESINKKYLSNLPKVNPNNYKGVDFP